MFNKTCKRCLQEKPVAQFSPRRDAKDGLAYWCTSCKSAVTAAGPRRAAVVRAYRERNKTLCAERVRAAVMKKPDAYKTHKETWVRENHEHVLQKRRANYATNPQPHILRSRRRVQRMQMSVSWMSQAERAEMDGVYRFCQLFTGFEVDHIVPLNGKQVSGLHVPSNLQVLSVRANRQKGAKYEVLV